MNSNNKLTSHHVVQLAIFVVLFVAGIIGCAWVYSRQFSTMTHQQSIEEILKQRFDKDPLVLTEEEKRILQKRFETKTTLTEEDKNILEERFNKSKN